MILEVFGGRLSILIPVCFDVEEVILMQDGELVKLLLRDFGGESGDWLWETDAQGLLRQVTPRLEKQLGMMASQLEGMPWVHVLSRTQPAHLQTKNPGWSELESNMIGETPFQDLPVKVWVGGEPRWWSLTAMPVSDSNGQIKGWKGVARDISVRKCHDDELEQQANFDNLTGLRSRFAFQKVLQASIVGAGEGRSFSVVHLDVNCFKAINSTLGYPTGDFVMQNLARRLLQFECAEVLPARLGGDDFIVCMWMPSLDCYSLAGKIVEALQQPIEVNHKFLEVQICAGVVHFPEHANDMGGLFQSVGMALAAAKEAGAGSVCVYEPEYGERFMHRLRTIQEIKMALEQQEFELWYQPQIDVESRTTVGAEALVRWRHPRRGLVSPLEFIPLAEQSGQIVALGAWVLEQACREAVVWPDTWKVSVNVAPVQLQTKGFLKLVERALRVSGLAAGRLKLEITESALVDGSVQTRNILQDLRTMGVCVSLDDFGTGYSSLSYLRQFPFNELKIDQSFVRAMVEDAESLAIVETILQLARALRLTTTAEGVETSEQAGMLQQIGCDRYQGYLYGRPMPHGQFLLEHACVAVAGYSV